MENSNTNMDNPNFNIDEIQKWWNQRPIINNAFSVESMRDIMKLLLTGKNYRIHAEKCVREKLYLIHTWLIKIVYKAKMTWGDNWLKELISYFNSNPIQTEELQLLKYLNMWLLGMGGKTVKNLFNCKECKESVNNLDISNCKECKESATFLEEIISQCRNVSQTIPWKDENITVDLVNSIDNTHQSFNLEESLLFLQIIGGSTLTIRGSNKAKYGKIIEKVFLKVCLDILGLEENSDYWIYGLNRDSEVEREVDGEVRTKRGRIEIEVTLIGQGNSEVGEDKIGRIGKNGVLLVDCLGPKSNVYKTAEAKGVELIQIRHGLPLVNLYTHLKDLVVNANKLNIPENTEAWMVKNLDNLPNTTFLLNSSTKNN